MADIDIASMTTPQIAAFAAAVGFNPGENYVEINLSAAQIRSLFSSPVTLLAAPGAGKVIQVIDAWVAYSFGTVAFAGGGDGAFLGYAGLDVSDFQIRFTDMFAQSSSQFASGLAAQESNNYYNLADCENKAVIISAAEDYNLGTILAKAVAAGGSGYAPGDTGIIHKPNGSGFGGEYTVATVDGGGAILTFDVTNNLPRFIVQNGYTTEIETGGGDGAFTLNVSSVSQGDGAARVGLGYRIVTLS